MDKFDRNERRNSICPIQEFEDITDGGEVGFLERYA